MPRHFGASALAMVKRDILMGILFAILRTHCYVNALQNDTA
jgi:hypothetical protein